MSAAFPLIIRAMKDMASLCLLYRLNHNLCMVHWLVEKSHERRNFDWDMLLTGVWMVDVVAF